MSKIKRTIREHIKDYLYNYDWLEEEIGEIRESIITPYIETDTNVGGGQSNIPASPDEMKAIKLADNIRLTQLERMKWAIDDVYDQVDDTGKTFMELYYFKKKYQIKGAADEAGISERTATRLNTKIIIEIAERVGWY